MVWSKEFWDTIEKKNISRFFPLDSKCLEICTLAHTVRRLKLTRLILDLCLLAFSKIILSTYGQYIGREPSLMKSDLVQPGLKDHERLDAFPFAGDAP